MVCQQILQAADPCGVRLIHSDAYASTYRIGTYSHSRSIWPSDSGHDRPGREPQHEQHGICFQ